MMNSQNGSSWTSAPVRRIPPRTYNEWLLILVSIGQTSGINTEQWKATLSAATKDISFRVWALRDDAEQAVRSAKS